MESITEMKPWTNVKKQYKKLSKKIKRVTTFAIAKLEERELNWEQKWKNKQSEI